MTSTVNFKIQYDRFPCLPSKTITVKPSDESSDQELGFVYVPSYSFNSICSTKTINIMPIRHDDLHWEMNRDLIVSSLGIGTLTISNNELFVGFERSFYERIGITYKKRDLKVCTTDAIERKTRYLNALATTVRYERELYDDLIEIYQIGLRALPAFSSLRTTEECLSTIIPKDSINYLRLVAESKKKDYYEETPPYLPEVSYGEMARQACLSCTVL